MSIKGKISIDGVSHNLLYYCFGTTQASDDTGRPVSKPVLRRLEVILEQTKDADLFDWAGLSYGARQVTVVLFSDREGKSRTIYFADCHLLEFQESFEAAGGTPASVHLTIAPGGVKDARTGTIYTNHWMQSDFEGDDTTPITEKEEETEPTIVDGYFTTKQGEKIEKDELKAGIEVYYVLHSKDGVGKIVDLDFSDAKNDFKYQGEVLENDLLVDFQITSDTQKIALEVIRQPKNS